jgi:hypothetical protein
MTTLIAEPELGTITIPDTVDQLLERIDEESDEWTLVLHESRWFKRQEGVRLPFRAPVPAPGTSITRCVVWHVDRRMHVVAAHVEGPTPEWGRKELHGKLEEWLIPGDILNVNVTLTNRDPA